MIMELFHKNCIDFIKPYRTYLKKYKEVEVE